jgi:hypothetical protein
LGEDASGLSASTVSRLCKEWETHHDRFRQRLLSFSRYAYLFMDGIHVQVRLGEDPKVCLLIVIGVREDGVKELLAVEDGYRESTESWAACSAISSAAGSTSPASSSVTAHSGLGRRSGTCSPAPVSNALGSTPPGT